jgi:cytidine deaminase
VNWSCNGYKTPMKITQAVEDAYQVALSCRTHSHSPYSKFAVGAGLKIRGAPTPVGGCNVENASFGGTMCAERVAVHAAVAAFGKIAPEFIVVVTGEEKATVPCALCLQTLAEFCGDDFSVYLGNEKSVLVKYTLKELLPHPFRSFQATSK